MVSHSLPLAYEGIKPLICHYNSMNKEKQGFILINPKIKKEGFK